ncbi:MAG: PilZ domain-containing protein [Deltaproteobacteria bacterium]|nr:PilZ domain-containing protein [Deltaproteobacteria bacterium]
MRNDGGQRPERRNSTRMAPKGTVSIRSTDYDVRGRLANVGTGGLCAITLVTVPDRLLDRTIELEIRFDTQHGAWIQLTGRVMRIGATSIAVAFDNVPDNFEALIDETLTASHQRNRVISIVLVDATVERRQRIAEAFRAAGCAVVDVSTPLEAIVRLGEFHFEPDVIAIADSLPTTISGELRQFVATEHPRAKMVTIGDDAIEPEGLAHWLSSVDPGGNLAKRVRLLLLDPRRKTPD